MPEFDLAVTSSGDGYAVSLRAAFGVDLPPQPLTLPLALPPLPNYSEIGEWVRQAQVVRLRGGAEVAKAREIGGALFHALLSGELYAAFRAARAALLPDERLRFRLRLPAAMIAIPWELLYDPQADQFLALADDLALIRYPELSTRIAPLRLTGPLQVVAVAASPKGQRSINLDRELARIESALHRSIARGQAQLDIIRGAGTLDQLRMRLNDPVHVLHILCHGDLDAENGDGLLLFEDSDSDDEPVSAELLRLNLEKQRGQTRLVVLNACVGAVSSGEPFGSVGAALVRGGAPAVIAMQFEIPADSAAELTRVLYADLAAGRPVDAALTEARRHLYGRDRFRLDWAVPVLLMRGEDGALFAGPPPPLPERQPAERSEAEDQGSSPTAGGFDAVALRELLVQRFSEGELRDLCFELNVDFESLPGSRKAAKARGLVAYCQRHQRIDVLVGAIRRLRADVFVRPAVTAPQPNIEQLWRQALAAYYRKDWRRALALLDEVATLDPAYRDVQARRDEARRQADLRAAYDDLAALRDEGDWRAVLGGLDDLERRQPGYPDPHGLRAWAEARKRHDELYDAALAACDRSDWPDAISVLEALLAETPDDDARLLLDHARAEAAVLERREAEARERRAAEERARSVQAQHDRVLNDLRQGVYAAALARLQALLADRRYGREALQITANLIEDVAVPLEHRLRAASLAAEYGDVRPGVCALPRSLDDPYWADVIPVGRYPIGDGKAAIPLAAFRVARYPVTVWQFRQFWQDPAGYESELHWPKQGWAWKQSGSETKQPALWDNPDWMAKSQPVIGVSWYEAVLFCRWLDGRGRTEGWLPADLQIRLPSEAQWEVAAMWDAGARAMRPWGPPEGELWQNCAEAGIGRTSAVGLFPQGMSPCGALDMAGNAWEWCSSAYEGYPSASATPHDDFEPYKLGPALRGGAYYLQNTRSGWGVRVSNDPDDQYSGGSFRVCVFSCSVV